MKEQEVPLAKRPSLSERLAAKRAKEKTEPGLQDQAVIFQPIPDVQNEEPEEEISHNAPLSRQTVIPEKRSTVSKKDVNDVVRMLEIGNTYLEIGNPTLTPDERRKVIAIATWIKNPYLLKTLASKWNINDKKLIQEVFDNLSNPELFNLGGKVFDRQQKNDPLLSMKEELIVGKINDNLPKYFRQMGIRKKEAEVFILYQQKHSKEDIGKRTGLTVHQVSRVISSLVQKVDPFLEMLDIVRTSKFGDKALIVAASKGLLVSEIIVNRSYTSKEYVTMFYNNTRRINTTLLSQGYLLITDAFNRKEALGIRSKYPHLLTKQSGRLYISPKNLESYRSRINNQTSVHPANPELLRLKALTVNDSEYKRLRLAIKRGTIIAAYENGGWFISRKNYQKWKESSQPKRLIDQAMAQRGAYPLIHSVPRAEYNRIILDKKYRSFLIKEGDWLYITPENVQLLRRHILRDKKLKK